MRIHLFGEVMGKSLMSCFILTDSEYVVGKLVILTNVLLYLGCDTRCSSMLMESCEVILRHF